MIPDQAPWPTPTATHGAPPRLMVVDDVAESRAALAEFFAARGWQVVVAVDGVDALTQTIAHGVDAVVMNALLPGLEGYETAAILRRLHPQIQIVLMLEPRDTAPRGERQRVERFRCFPKPLDLDAIARAIEAPPTAGLAERDVEERR